MSIDIRILQSTVQHNCHICDARHASDYTLCVYLLKMREYYRWEQGLAFDHTMDGEDVGSWLTRREGLWERLEEEDLRPLEIAGEVFDPFDTGAINERLRASGLVYAGGIGHRGAPHFFLGELLGNELRDGYRIHVAGREFARDLTAPPAMAQGQAIFIRRESLKRMIWEKVQEWRWHQYENAMARTLSYYDFDADLDAALERITSVELESATLHEIGELRAGRLLGEGWGEMMLTLPRSRAEIMARAVRDHLADALCTLPELIRRENAPSLHFYMANLTAMRKDLYPGFTIAYDRWAGTNDLRALRELTESAADHWLKVARGMLDIHRAHGENCHGELERFVDTSRFTG